MKICIVGSGAIAMSTAVDLINTGNEVVLYTSHYKLFGGTVTEIDENDNEISTVSGIKATYNLDEALENADYVFITYPAFLLYDFADKLYNSISNETVICVFPGTGGVEFAFKRLIEKGITVAGLQRVPYIARVKEKGRVVKMSGKKTELFCACIPSASCSDICADFEKMFSIDCHRLDNYLSVTFTPSNPILHTTRLYSMLHSYPPHFEFDRNFLFYEEWNDESSQLLINCDAELQTLCRSISEMNLSDVVSLKEYYESPTAEAMTDKISHITAFRGIGSPMLQGENGKWRIDWSSRYFTADFPYGLAIIKAFARTLSLDTPSIDTVLKWYVDASGNSNAFDLSEYGIYSKEDIINFYHQ